MDARVLSQGAYHEIRELILEDGCSCTGRFTRDLRELVGVLESESATTQYLRTHTTIPVSEVYFTNLNPNHVVGSAFTLMEKLPGQHLSQIWDSLSLRHKFEVLKQITGLLVQLSQLRFDEIGPLDSTGKVAALQNLAYPQAEQGRGPFREIHEYFSSFLHPPERRSNATIETLGEIEGHMNKIAHNQCSNSLFRAPFRLMHGDFDAQNMLFTWEVRDEPPKISGVIDWDYSWTGPLYYLYDDYPCFILDNGNEREKYQDNRVLRKVFVWCSAKCFANSSQERRDVQECFRQKS